MSNRWDAVRAACEPVIAQMGYELAELAFVKEPDTGWVLTFYIHKDGGVSLNDCEAVSRAIEPVVDELDPSDDAYYLSVSSLGLDRPFKTLRDFERYLDREIELRFYAPVELAVLRAEGNQPEAIDPAEEKKKTKGQKKTSTKQVVGLLRKVSDEAVEIEAEGERFVIPREKLSLARPYVRW